MTRTLDNRLSFQSVIDTVRSGKAERCFDRDGPLDDYWLNGLGAWINNVNSRFMNISSDITNDFKRIELNLWQRWLLRRALKERQPS